MVSVLRYSRFPILPAVATSVWILVPHIATAQTDYRIQERDALLVSVANQPELSQKYAVGADGAVTLPLVGRVRVIGQTAEQAAADLQRRFAEYLRAPRVRVEVERLKRVFVFGEIKSPGTYPLTEHLTLLELLTQAGYAGPSEVIVVRPSVPGMPAPLDGSAGSKVIRVSMADLEHDLTSGELSRNVALADGDTIFVPRTDPNRVTVSGHVRNPGPYSIPEGTTVLQAVTLAGGPTPEAEVRRIRIYRFVGGEQESLEAELEDVVLPGDTVSVPESLLLPFFVGEPDLNRRTPLQMRLGESVLISPSFVLKRVGVDSNVFNSDDNPRADFTASAGPQVDLLAALPRFRLKSGAGADFVYYRRHGDERSVNRRFSVGAEFRPVSRVSLSGKWSRADTRERFSAELDARARRSEDSRTAGVTLAVSRRLAVDLASQDWNSNFAEGEHFLSVNLQDTLTARVRGLSAKIDYTLTPSSTLVLSGATAKHRFPLLSAKNAETTELSIGGTFRPRAVVLGEARVGYLRYLTPDPAAPDFEGVTAAVDLQGGMNDRTILGAKLERVVGDSFQPRFAFAIIDRYGGSLRRVLSSRWDVSLESYRETYRYEAFTFAGRQDSRETTQRYASQVGLRVKNAARVTIDAIYVQRLSRDSRSRAYNDLRMEISLTYGAFSLRGL